MICLNGNQVSDCEGLSLEDFIAKQNFEKNKIAVEINGEIIPKERLRNGSDKKKMM